MPKPLSLCRYVAKRREAISNIGDLVATLVTDTKQWSAGLDKAKAELNTFTSAVTTSLAGLAGAFATVDFAKEMIASAESDILAVRKLESVLDATGGAAGVTADEISKLAGELQRTTKFEDDATVGAAALLTQFKGIKGVNFTETLKLAQDLAALKDIGLNEAVTQLGKALNDPAEGLTKLTRAGITLTDEQEKLIKSLVKVGDTAGAQVAMLRALEESFGGTAEKTVTSTQKIENALGDLVEMGGKQIVPYVNLFANNVVPVMYETGDAVTSLGGALDSQAVSLHSVFNATKNLMPEWMKLVAAAGLLHLAITELDAAQEGTDFGDGAAFAGGDFGDMAALEESMPNFAAMGMGVADFSGEMEKLNQQLLIAAGQATETDFAIQKMMEDGLSQEGAAEMRKAMDMLEILKDLEKANAENDRLGESVTKALRTPEEVFADRIDELKMLLDTGRINQETFDRGVKKAEKEAGGKPESTKTPGGVAALQKGSADTFSAIFTAMRGNDSNQTKQLKAQEEIAANTARAVELAEQRGGVELLMGSLS